MKYRAGIPLVFFCVIASCIGQASLLFKLLPRDGDVKGWTRKGDARSFKAEQLWEYINGGADVYLDYGFKEVVTVDLASSEKNLVVDLYEFDTFEGAFGMYARERAPTYHYKNYGAGGYLEGVSLNFYQAKNYVKISAFSDDADTKKAMDKVAQIVSGNIGTYKKTPTLLGYFMPDDLVRFTETFEKKSYLGRAELRESYTAQYKVKGKTVTAFFSACESAAAAETRLKGLRAALTQAGSKDKEYAALSASVLTGRHREVKDVVFIVKGKNILGVHPVTDIAATRKFLKEFAARFP